MPERRPKPKPVVRRRDVYTEPDGLFGRITDAVIENPVRTGGFVMVVIVVGAIVTNAAYFQTAHHPAPFFATRPDAGTEATSTVPLPKQRAGQNAANQPAKAEKPLASAPAAAPIPTDPVALLMETQRSLAALKLYDGAVDGKMGRQTRAAITAFETEQGLPATGQPSARLLALLRKVLPRSSNAAPSGDGPAAAALPAQPADPTATGSIDPIQSAARIRKVQSALNDIGYGPIRVDGNGGGDTEDAVRRFELDNGLALTGEVNDMVVQKLIAIGAMKSI
ncbi:peptidoglycan-binding domain-containing protein [Kaistia geumhonensis]|uniref:Peptidoglycan hydrolase-like protein with peptidoglycan-binding domain n=1 Tax=Kaistia geumhonensis TaxID=410839 RepID=A0ABU0M3P4_9HYPH|nr:peptidoglycan-binding domain-containing protein [Kaistia geumhonensis]MCX5479193.1 peptidoglycan-binding domain-containing protein [Kaistia geumhonensis]MDQ0515587.1 peptidoglycan hydrolase-like protein with peptidoglycan-binding domain [Kaistia geumhonensis]